MLTIDWNAKTGWNTPLIAEHSNINLSPAALVLHYGIEVSINITYHYILLYIYVVFLLYQYVLLHENITCSASKV